ncbi:hypothetical protein EVAR_14044_1 [Eumeta japonica]|uniref:Uncharacterized protein n=1 Tax=Eumeta variegata TaxID=151549 RepID=A0A4C1UPH6_EUMVA|nr:hypothetical protein EVAR_14044_1 [Eumeta japonica]
MRLHASRVQRCWDAVPESELKAGDELKPRTETGSKSKAGAGSRSRTGLWPRTSAGSRKRVTATVIERETENEIDLARKNDEAIHFVSILTELGALTVWTSHPQARGRLRSAGQNDNGNFAQCAWDEIDKSNLERLLEEAPNSTNKARLRTALTLKSETWSHALPSPNFDTSLDDYSLRVVVAFWLGCNVYEHTYAYVAQPSKLVVIMGRLITATVVDSRAIMSSMISPTGADLCQCFMYV